MLGCGGSESSPDAVPPLPMTEALVLSGNLQRTGGEVSASVTLIDASGHPALATFRFWPQPSPEFWNWCVNCDAELEQTCEGGVEFTSGEIGAIRFDEAGFIVDFVQSDGSGVLSAQFDADPWNVCLIRLDATGAFGLGALSRLDAATSVHVRALP